MPASQLVSAQHGIIAWSKNADGDTARPVVLIAIHVRRSMEPTGRGVASNIGRPIPTHGVQATTTLSKGYWAFAGRTAPRIVRPWQSLPSQLWRFTASSSAVWAFLWWSKNEIDDGLAYRGQAWLRRKPGRQAARLDHSGFYLRMPRLFEDLTMARLDGRFPRLIDKLARVQLLILDDGAPTVSSTSSVSISWKSWKSATGANPL